MWAREPPSGATDGRQHRRVQRVPVGGGSTAAGAPLLCRQPHQ